MQVFISNKLLAHRLAGFFMVIGMVFLSTSALPWPPQTKKTIVTTQERLQVTPQWQYPVPSPPVFGRMFAKPKSDYGAGHRGIDFQTDMGDSVTAPVAGVIFFSGIVADKPVLTIRVDEATLLSFEPLETSLSTGEEVTQGELLGTTGSGGHCTVECLHVGVRIEGVYVNPLRFFAGKPYLLPIK